MLKWLSNRIRGKSTPDPRTEGGWEVLRGNMKGWTRANEIWEQHGIDELEAIARTQLVVYACVKKICLTAQEAPPKLGFETKEGWTDIVTHPALSLLKKPNPAMAYPEFLWHFISHLLLTGETHLWKWRNRMGQVSEIWPVPTSWIKPKTNDSGRVVGYEIFQGQNKEKLPIPNTDVCRIIFPDPTNLTAGLGPLQAASKDVQTDENREDYIVEMLENAKTPGTIFTQPEGWEEEQKNEIRALFNSGLGKGKRGRTIFLEGEGATISQGTPLKDLDWPGLSALSETRICAAFGVPPILIGLRSGLQTATYSNYEQALKSFAQGTMVPTWNMLDVGLTRGLLTDEQERDGRLEIYHDTGNVQTLQEDQTKRVERATRLWSAGLVSRNRALEIAGEEKITGSLGDEYIMPMSMVTVGSDGVEVPPKDTGAKSDEQAPV